jgi:hypothetical protein
MFHFVYQIIDIKCCVVAIHMFYAVYWNAPNVGLDVLDVVEEVNAEEDDKTLVKI